MATATFTATPTVTSTPYKTIYNGYINCRSGPGDSLPIVTTVRGQVITILAKDSISPNWLLVQIEGGQTCWLNNAILNLPALNMALLLTTDSLTPRPTFTFLPPGTQPTATDGNGGGGGNPNLPTPNQTLTAQAVAIALTEQSRILTEQAKAVAIALTEQSRILTEQAKASTMHVDDVSGQAILISNPPFRWKGEATIAVVDGNGKPLSGVTVTGNWTSGNSQSCTTKSNGMCTITSPEYKNNDSSAVFTLSNLSGSYTYRSGDNSASQAQVEKP